MTDKTQLGRFSGRYLAALRTSLEGEAGIDSRAARRLGLQAGKMGLKPPDLAKVHNLAFKLLALPPVSEEKEVNLASRATDFFSQATLPPPNGRDPVPRADLAQLDAALVLRTQEAKESRAKLREGVTRRKSAESSLQASKRKSTRLLAESQPLQKHLQHLVHRILTAQESERKILSSTLQDEIAQTLLGIEIRLQALGKEAAASNDDFKKEIAATQKLVEKSVRTITRFARLFGSPDEN